MQKIFQYILFFCVVVGYSQSSIQRLNSINNELNFYLLDVELGLSNNVVNSIEQDSLGFIWVGTPDGLNRYDGTEFTVFKKESNNDNLKLNDNFINEVKVVDDGRLLIATNESFNIYNSKNGFFKTFNQENGLIGNSISVFETEPNGRIFLGIFGAGVQIIDKSGETAGVFVHNPEDENSLSSNIITCMVRQGDSLLWIGTNRNGLNKLNYKTKKVSRVKLNGNSDDGLRIEGLFVDSDDNLWVGSNEGVFAMTAKGDTLHLEQSSQEGKGLSDNDVRCFEEDNFGQMWIGTTNGGLNIINKSDFLKRNFQVKWYLPADDGSSVFNRTVSSIKKDFEGNMWIGTSTGINFVSPRGEPIKLIRKRATETRSISHNRIGALAESFNGKIWIGTDGAGLDLLNPKTGEFKRFRHQPNNSRSLSNNYIISLFEDSKQRLWVGTYRGGLNQMDIETGNCKHYLQGDADSGSDVRVIFEDSKANIWVGTNRGGVFKYDEKSGQFHYISSLGKLDVRDIDEDAHGDLWMATYGNGILKYSPTLDDRVFYNHGNIEGFKTNVIYSILVLPSGDILAGTQNEGLLRFNPIDGDIDFFTEANGLSNNTVSCIIMENQKNIWLGTYNGISNYNALTDKIFNLKTYTNIQQGKFNIGSGLITSSGMVYLGGDKGLNVFNPDNLHDNIEVYPVVFKGLEVLGERVQVNQNEEDGVLDKSIFYEDHIRLKPHQTFFSLDYTALKYPFTKNVTYSYKVDGYNNQWINTNQFGKVNLVNLPFGDYTLNVKAKFGSGDEVIKKMNLTIEPPFWRTTWAYIGYVLVLVAAIYWFMKYYTERVKLINSLAFEKKQRQLEYNFNEERIRFFTSFSHELKTPLTLILAPIEDLIGEVKSLKQKNSLTLIQKNAKQLLQTINKLLEFRKANLGLSKLRINQHNLTECLEQWVDNYFPLAKKRGIALRYDFPQEPLITWFDLEKLHIIFNNLISNAFKYTPDNGEVLVTLSYDEESFEIKVKDTGYGITPEELEYVFERYYQSNSVKRKNGIGIGLSLSKSFVELHMGTISIESKPNLGSTFTVVIPRDESLFTDAVIDTVNVSDTEITEPDIWVPELYSESKTSSNLVVNDNRELVLLIDDNPDILKYLDGLLEGKYDLIYAKNGEEGVEKAKRYIPDLIVSDVMMPKMDGIELCNVLKETTETTHIPIILLTAKGNTESIQEGYQYGADDYIVKPFSSQILQARIHNLLESRKRLRSYFLNAEEEPVEVESENDSVLKQEKVFLKKLTQVILENLDKEKSDVWDISQDMGMSRTSLFRKVKAITGLNINQYTRKVKIDKAAELIKSGNYTIAQASYEVGFNNVKYFRKLFKEQFEKLPSDLTKN